MIRFKAGLNPDIKERMSVHQSTFYVDLYENCGEYREGDDRKE